MTYDPNLANNGHDPSTAKDADEYDTRAKQSLASATIDNSFNLMEALDEVVFLSSPDPAKADLEVFCHFPEPGTNYPCATHLCDAEVRDSLATLVRVAVAHFEEVHAS